MSSQSDWLVKRAVLGDQFAEVFAVAAERGVHVVHHAGEACGGPSIRQAITSGRAERLGHGIRVLEDPDLVDAVRRRHIPLEVCPASNVALGCVSSLRAHPLPVLRAEGLLVTVNTDIPLVTGMTLAAEYAAVRDAFGYDDTELAGNAVHASFAREHVKAGLREGIARWLTSPSG